jgi:ABC-2 type transport system ATP-binding protein
MPVLAVDALRKTYGSLTAVDGISFAVEAGEIFGIVGPNGAGKTTTIECCEGLRQPDSGRVNVLGLDPQTAGAALRERIGMQLQESALPPRIRVGEALDLFSAFYRHPLDWKAMMERLGLAEKRNAIFTSLSGGQKQRLYIALALINNPEVVFLDELTTGLDPQARHSMWDLVRDVRSQGKTICLTTHFMEEAERLCDRVAIVDHGKIVALDTPVRLIASLGAENRILFLVDRPLDTGALRGLQAVRGVTRVEQAGDRVLVYGKGETLVGDVVNALTAGGIPFRDLRTEAPSLEDVFLALTGRDLRE